MPDDDGRGDMVLEFSVDFPDEIPHAVKDAMMREMT